MRQVVQFVIDSLSVGSLYALLSLGIALVFGIMGLINFAHGELIVASGYTLAIVSAGSDVLRILPVILIAVVLALLLERVAFRPLRGAPPRHAARRLVRRQLLPAEPGDLDLRVAAA